MVDVTEVKKYASQIHENSNKLVNIINDTLKLSELDYEGITPVPTRFDLFELVSERVEFLQSGATRRGIRLEVSGEKAEIISDKHMISAVIDNLIQNAVRYNINNGRVMVSVFNQGEKCILQVSDSGIGIPKEDIPRIFERFYRVDKSRSKETGGTGLGLAIVKHIVELLGCSIEVESEVGRGTVFTVLI